VTYACRRQQTPPHEGHKLDPLNIPVAALAPIVILVLGFIAYCLMDLSKHEVHHLPRWLWAVACTISVPLGGILYLLIGRGDERQP
jgi:hypothetical protein